ncbi:MAG: exodeoxyribonuclease VII small subunit [Saprospiraceae bacterium]|nr:exodeoxyribonuclease VII small subunit [Saprospiraceae bacterium]
MKKLTSYEAAYAELQEILQQVQDADTGLDDLEKYMERANVLVEFCKTKLRSLESKLDEFQPKKTGQDSLES